MPKEKNNEDCYWYVDCEERGKFVYIYTKNLRVKDDEHEMASYSKNNKEIARQYAYEKKDKSYLKMLEKLGLSEKDRLKNRPNKKKGE